MTSPRTISAVSCLTGIYLANVSRTIKEFEERGLIENITPDECRGKLYQLTPQGHALVPEFENYYDFQKIKNSRNL
jgi:DNA-binding MarR family transcriptional regulator